MAERREYVLDCGDRDREAIDASWRAAFEVVLPLTTTGRLDGYIGWPDPPVEVLAIYERLAAKHGEKNLMALQFDLLDADQRSEFMTFAPWSIDADAADDDGTVLASVHDASSVVARLTLAEAALLRERLSAVGHADVEVVDGDEWDIRRRQRKREARSEAIGRLLNRLRF